MATAETTPTLSGRDDATAGPETLTIRGRQVLICDCEGTMSLDAKALGSACASAGGTEAPVAGLKTGETYTHLCRTQLNAFQAIAAQGTPLMVASTQDAH